MVVLDLWRSTRQRVISVALLGVLAGCARYPVGPAGNADASMGVASCAASVWGSRPALSAGPLLPTVPSAVADGAGALPWVELMRAERWSEAAAGLNQLSPEARQDSWIRLACARSALGLRDWARSLQLLEGLEGQLPELSKELQRWRAEAQFQLGRHPEAARYYAQSQDPRDQLRSALAWEKAGQLVEAQGAVGRLLAKLSAKDRLLEAEARATRARLFLAQKRPDLAIQDLRWLANVVPTSVPARDAAEQLQQLVGMAALSPEQRLKRAFAWAQQGEIQRAEAELSPEGSAPAPPVSELNRARVGGYARFSARSDLSEAARMLGRAAQLGGDPKDAFYAARAHIRAGDAAAALVLLVELADHSANPDWAGRARFEAGRLEMMQAHWAEAVGHYERYLKRNPRGSQAKPATYERAVALLGAGNFDRAANQLSRLIEQQDTGLASARLRQLRGVAWWNKGSREAALADWRQVMADAPLSLAAALAAERLVQSGEPLPAWPPAAFLNSPAQPITLPPRVQALIRVGLDRDAERVMRAEENSFLGPGQRHSSEALCGIYSLFDGAERRFSVGRGLSERISRTPGTEPAWAWNCSYPRPYPTTVRSVEKLYGIPSDLVYAVMRQESAFRPEVRSPVDARGLMQLMPSTARRVAEELRRPWEPELLNGSYYNIELGTYYLGKLLRRLAEHPALAAAAYNAGPGAVTRWLETGDKLPLDLFVARIPFPETRDYVHQVISNWLRYRYLTQGPAGVPRIPLEIPQGLRPADSDY